jgi:hypothetical protein
VMVVNRLSAGDQMRPPNAAWLGIAGHASWTTDQSPARRVISPKE